MILRSLWHYRRTNIPVALAAAAATAVLAGALLVGDSMRGSLRDLALDRLGRIDSALVARSYFRQSLAQTLAADPGFQRHFTAAPAISLQISLEADGGQPPLRASRVALWGCAAGFSQLGRDGPPEPIAPRHIVLNRALADHLRVGVGEIVLAHLPSLSAIPGDSPLGRKHDTAQTQRLTVSGVVADRGLGGFALRPSQQAPRNAYVALDWLAEQLEQAGRANVILAAGKEDGAAPRVEAALVKPWQPGLADYGLRLRRSPLGYWDVASNQMLVPPETERLLSAKLDGLAVQPALTYLANRIACGAREIPYSTVAAVDFSATPPLGPFRDAAGQSVAALREGQIALNRWAADDLQARLGDAITLTYFEPESLDGQVRERTARFTLAAIVEMQGAAVDPGFTPEVPGVTDQRSISDWDPPFPFDAKRIRLKDDHYWLKYRATPKAFVGLDAGRRLWSSRFGQTTTLRFAAPPGAEKGQLETRLALAPADMGFTFTPLRLDGLAAAAGTTPFGVLFVSFSSFTIVAAVLLVVLLFRLGAESRAAELGLLLAVGAPPARARRWLLAEAALVVTAGSLLGMPLGVGYAALMLWGLRTWWLPAIGTPFLQLHLAPLSPLIGAGVVIVMALVAMWFALRRMEATPCRALLAGQVIEGPTAMPLPWSRVRRQTALLAAALAAIWGAVAFLPLDEAGRAAAFVGGGAATLAILLAIIRLYFRAGAAATAVSEGRGNVLRLAARNAARHPGRSLLTIGLMAAASFLIVAMSAFQVDPMRGPPRRSDGTGGFAVSVQTDLPLLVDLNSTAGRSSLGFTDAEQAAFDGVAAVGFRTLPGDDASCRNLYQARRPRVLGVPRAMLERGGFAWDASAAATPEERANPWLLLGRRLDREGERRIPVVLEKNTAVYALQLTGGVGAIYRLVDDRGRTFNLEVVGLLSSSVFQGDLLIDEGAFLDAFPDVSGRQFFLIDAAPEKVPPVEAAIDRALGDYGAWRQTTAARLAEFLAVQNTYLSTFQSLGGLGLLLGALGVAAVQLRNVAQRRGELALLRAIGFSPAALAAMVLLETGLLLLVGVGSGALAAFCAVLPQMLGGGASVPWLSLAGLLLSVVLVGLAAGLTAVRAALRAPLVPALRQQ